MRGVVGPVKPGEDAVGRGRPDRAAWIVDGEGDGGGELVAAGWRGRRVLS